MLGSGLKVGKTGVEGYEMEMGRGGKGIVLDGMGGKGGYCELVYACHVPLTIKPCYTLILISHKMCLEAGRAQKDNQI